jgi:[NiFe] hydrogenase assembly HybE family chaperone
MLSANGDILLRPDPSASLVQSFRRVAQRMHGLDFVNPALDVEAVAFGPWEGRWLGVLVTPWFMNLILAPRDAAAWTSVKPGKKRTYLFPAGAYDFIGARDDDVGEYQMCSLFSPLLHFDDQETARLVAGLAREALFDAANAENAQPPVGNLSPAPASGAPESRPLAKLQAQLNVPQSKRDFLRARWTGNDRDTRR